MPDFAAKTRRQLQGIDDPPSPGVAPPCAEEEGLRDLGQTETWPRILEYRNPKHSLADMMKPNYFSGDLRSRMHTGDEIHYILYGGSKLPSDWQRGICVVLENPNTREQPLILAGIVAYPQPTPWRGDNDKSKAAA